MTMSCMWSAYKRPGVSIYLLFHEENIYILQFSLQQKDRKFERDTSLSKSLIIQ